MKAATRRIAWRKPSATTLAAARGPRRAFSTTPRRLDTYAFIGLGQMGYQMARNLRAKLPSSDTLRLYDINRSVAEKLAHETSTAQGPLGAATEVSSSAHEAAREATTVITCLPEPEHVLATYNNILTGAPPPSSPRSETRLFIDCSTIDPATSNKVAAQTAAAAAAGAWDGHFVDAPMSGGVVGATAGTLTFMVGASQAVFPGAEAVLLRMGARVLHCGAQGSGLAAKLANNYLLAVENIATAEAMHFGVRWGLDPQVLARVINVSTGRCWPSEVNNPVPGVMAAAPASRDYKGGFGIGLMRKDLRLAMQAADEKGARLPLAAETSAVYEAAEADDRYKGRDFSVVYRWLSDEGAGKEESGSGEK
ncbi:3-hydroxyisobutyrate dehydrogenase-like protein [Lasiosphaeria ovina]|uniref:3-hydroxyisobutyrate dehydrogenase n=1 Tax=Lasiosphaeria ovina TaxID=92902 RepID=A0AAE0KM74_9PEZI|nr:3-hydroxyisobutyrate dehydrogenase-like protein [Lasiosphaeria ovina]